ncbi:metallophosphoesterase [Patescibacteria group bacterium]|nr:metallophosphoesterase [Patescibacteria group bacterium]
MDFSFIKFLPFIVFGLVFIFGGHYFIYRSLVSAFNISGFFKLGLAVFLFILPLAFFASAFVAHFDQGWLSRVIYIISASWLGIAINLLLAAILIWLMNWLMNLAGLNFNRLVFGAVIFSAAIIFSAYGFWNAQHPQVKNITIKIKNLPAAWQGKTIVQLADIHLGRVHGEKFLQNIVDQTNAQNPDLILITGDLFDGMDGGLDVFIEPLNNLRAKEGVFFVTGNHESYVGLDRALTALRQTTIKILINEIVVVDGLQIVGLDYSLLSGEIGITGRSSDEEKIINSLPGWDRDKPSILMYHAPINIGQAVATGINFQLSGHSHNGQIWPFNFFTWLIYGQYDYGLNSLGDFTIYTTNGLGTWGPPMRTGNTPEIPVFKLK